VDFSPRVLSIVQPSVSPFFPYGPGANFYS
jgi:hypothetical protein